MNIQLPLDTLISLMSVMHCIISGPNERMILTPGAAEADHLRLLLPIETELRSNMQQ
jgi:hypothetical protein